jgi:hypothetical protein
VRVARTATLYSELFEVTQQNEKGSHRLPFLHFWPDQKPQATIVLRILRIIIAELDGCCGDAKLGDGGAGPSPNAGDDAGRATTRDSYPVARQDALSSGQG